MVRRQGATLVEVLIAIFVMGIGMIALLTLFPLGAIRMAQAIQDDRCATAVANANAVATLWDIRNDTYVSAPPEPPFNQSINVFKDKIPTQGRVLAADPNGPSYPVFVDPVGFQSSPVGSAQYWLCGNTPYRGLIARVPVSFAPNPTTVSKWFWLLDDFIFDTNERSGGVPFDFNPIQPHPIAQDVIRRDVRFSWAYLLQRPRSGDSSIAACSVVVFKNRPLSLTGALALPESAFSASFDVTTNTISVPLSKGTAPPNVNPGDWILDSTLVPGQTYGSAHGYFYRVVGITQTPAPNPSVVYEVQQKLRGFPANTAGPFPGTIMVLEGIADVYERGVDRKFN